MSAAVRCRFSIVKEWPGHRVVLSRRQCKNLTRDPSGYCWQHIPLQLRDVSGRCETCNGLHSDCGPA